MKIFRSTSSLEQLKAQVKKALKKKYDEIKIIRLFNHKGFEVDEDEVYDVLNSNLLFVSIKGEGFSYVNYINRFNLHSLVKLSEIEENTTHIVTKDILNNETLFASKKKLLGFFEKNQHKSSNLHVNYNHTYELANKIQRLRHSAIIELKDLFKHENYMYFLYENIDNINLTQFLNQEKIITELKAKIIIKQVADLLRYCHNRSIKHNNIHPNNILFKDKLYNKIKVNVQC